MPASLLGRGKWGADAHAIPEYAALLPGYGADLLNTRQSEQLTHVLHLLERPKA